MFFMKNLYGFYIFVFMLSFSGNAQLNDYKYIIVPKRFEIFKQVNQYQTSTILKHLFATNDYNVIYNDALPAELNANGCLGLRAELEENSSLFMTKVNIVLKDCNGQVVFRSQEGRSKEKEFKAGYTQAIKNAFESLKALDYKYTPKNLKKEDSITIDLGNDVKFIDNEGKEVRMVKQEATAENQSYVDRTPKPSNIIKGDSAKEVPTDDLKTKILYAQPTEGGFQLVDDTPKIQYQLTKTSVDNVFLARQGNKNGVVLKKDDKWYFEYTQDGIKIFETLNIKF